VKKFKPRFFRHLTKIRCDFTWRERATDRRQRWTRTNSQWWRPEQCRWWCECWGIAVEDGSRWQFGRRCWCRSRCDEAGRCRPATGTWRYCAARSCWSERRKSPLRCRSPCRPQCDVGCSRPDCARQRPPNTRPCFCRPLTPGRRRICWPPPSNARRSAWLLRTPTHLNYQLFIIIQCW